MSSDEKMRSLVLNIARALVDDHQAVSIDIGDQDGLVTINLQVTNSDLGKIIGKQGRTARSIRTILGAAGMRLQRRYHLNIQPQTSAETPLQ